jgi:hypothetical protein
VGLVGVREAAFDQLDRLELAEFAGVDDWWVGHHAPVRPPR